MNPTPYSMGVGQIIPPSDGGRGAEWRSRWTMLRLFSWRHGYITHRGPQRAWFARWGTAFGHGRIGVEFGRDDDGEFEVSLGLWPLWLDLSTSAWLRPNGQHITPPKSHQNGSEGASA